ncbi:hypothetical protein [Streptomyces sp. KMM 9044]|uniref:hypothetical protein n=1 Tax=Streptomyces sp. KMM 9044 TaxID=2744474 RepID=UPI002151B911|nr:hypothetical protein [Streptomyces sp. KMM 9044]WAX76472.1 hypothetical protein HUV60_000990 [Streptomyces sp. KMM 9044]
MGNLVYAAVSDRPLDEVADLITSLARSPEHTRAVVDVLRAIGVSRSVEDVARLVVLLTRPPRDADSADEVIRAAAAHRPVEDVTRLVALLHSEQLAPHCREEALRAAASGRSVEELIELIDRLAAQPSPDPTGRPTPEPFRYEGERGDPDGGYGTGNADGDRRGEERGCVRDDERRERPGAGLPPVRRGARGAAALHSRRRARRPGRRAHAQAVRSVTWSSWSAVVALAVCAVVHFPLRGDGSSLVPHALAVGLPVLCTVLALILVVRPGALVLAAAVVLPAALAGAHAYGDSFPSAALSRAVGLALAPQWLAGAAAVVAALLALTALVVRVASPFPGRHWAVWPEPGTPRMPD